MFVHVYICIHTYTYIYGTGSSVQTTARKSHDRAYSSEYEEKLTYMKKLLELVTSAKRLF